MIAIPHIQSIRKLGDLPNQDGFKFVGINKKFEHIPCKVRRDDKGLHKVEGALYSELIGWVPHGV